MNDIFNYSGFSGSVYFSDDDNCYYGKILNIRDLVVYSGDSIEELLEDFKFAVDAYIKDKE
jgi:predicted HicB family RNase H-like nuclease